MNWPAAVFSPHMDSHCILQYAEPLFDHGLVIRLDEQLCALTGLQLQAAETHWSDRDKQRGGDTANTSSHLDDVLLAGLVLGRPVHRAALQVHGELGLGLTASKLWMTEEGGEHVNLPCDSTTPSDHTELQKVRESSSELRRK